MGKETSFDEIIKILYNKVTGNIQNNNCYETRPAKVIKFYPHERTVDLIPSINIASNDGDFIESKTIYSVPVLIPYGSSYPLENEGFNEGAVFFTKISIDTWYSEGAGQNENIRSRGIHNCFFVPNATNRKTPKVSFDLDNFKNDVCFFWGKNLIRLKKDGGLEIIGNEVDVLTNLTNMSEKIENLTTKLSTALKSLASATYGGVGVPGPASCANDLLVLKDEVDDIKNDLVQIKQDFTKSKE